MHIYRLWCSLLCTGVQSCATVDRRGQGLYKETPHNRIVYSKMNRNGGIKWHTTGVEGTDIAGMDTGVTAGGNLAFWIPALIGASMVLGSASAGINAYYQYGAMKENERYWNDYYRNTGKKPLYPYRAGSVYNSSGLLGSASSFVRSWVPMHEFGTRQYQNLYR